MLFVSALIHHVVVRMKYKQSGHWVGVPAPPGCTLWYKSDGELVNSPT